jgi:hypothetical protein
MTHTIRVNLTQGGNLPIFNGECPIFCVTGIWFMLIEIGKDDDDDNFQRSAGRVAEGLQAA